MIDPHRAGRALALVFAVGCLAHVAAAASGAPAERIVVEAEKFVFSKEVIRVKKGRPVTLVLRTSDFAHGFAIPDFDVRVDLVPGRAVEVTFTPDRAGRFIFLCDNFCGEGHDAMSGILVVSEEQG